MGAMTPTEELIAALAKGLAFDDDADAIQFATEQLGLITPATRDKMLLGFALEGFNDYTLDMYAYTSEARRWCFRSSPNGRDISVFGPTPLAAVEAANKEVRDEPGIDPDTHACGAECSRE